MEDILYKLEWVYEESIDEEKNIILTFLRSYIYHYFKDDISLFLKDLAFGDKEFITKSFIINNQEPIIESKVIDINEAYQMVTEVTNKYITIFHVIADNDVIKQLSIKNQISVRYHNNLHNIKDDDFIILINPSASLLYDAIKRGLYIICFNNGYKEYKGKTININENDLNLISKTINYIIDMSIEHPLIGMDYIDIINMMKNYSNARVYFKKGKSLKETLLELLPLKAKGYIVFVKGDNTLTLKELEGGIEVLNSKDVLYGGTIDNTISDREVMVIALD